MNDDQYDAIDEVPVPDQWDDIVRRADEGALPLVREPEGDVRRRSIAVAAAVVLVVAIAAGVATIDRSDDEEVATVDTSEAPPTEPDPASDLPMLSCPDGELLAGSVPGDAVLGGEPLYTASMVAGTASWSWSVGDQQVQINVPPIPWADEGNPSEVVGDPKGTLIYQPRSTVFNATTGLAAGGGCDAYEVMVEGTASRDDDIALALDVARSLRWEPVDVPTLPDAVGDARSMRAFTLHAASEYLPEGAHIAELWVSHGWSESGVGGRAYLGNPALEPQWVWSGLVRVAGTSPGNDTVVSVAVGESGELMVGGGPVPAGAGDATTEPVTALVVGSSPRR